jgi:hypothetical protein
LVVRENPEKIIPDQENCHQGKRWPVVSKEAHFIALSTSFDVSGLARRTLRGHHCRSQNHLTAKGFWFVMKRVVELKSVKEVDGRRSTMMADDRTKKIATRSPPSTTRPSISPRTTASASSSGVG